MRECGQAVPRKVPTGRVLAHNHVRHAVDMPNGEACVPKTYTRTLPASRYAQPIDGSGLKLQEFQLHSCVPQSPVNDEQGRGIRHGPSSNSCRELYSLHLLFFCYFVPKTSVEARQGR